MFLGQFAHNIDVKSRTSLPARFREILDARGTERLVITADVEPCLLLYPQDQWQAFLDKLLALPRMDHRVKLVKRLFVGNAHVIGCDSAGRILIPTSLKKHAGLEKEAIFTGQVEHIEIWNPERWREACDETSADELRQALDELGI